MSFYAGFEKTAGIGGMVGAAGGTAQRAGKAVTKNIQQFAQKQRVDRVSKYRGALADKKPFGGGNLGKQKEVLSRLDSLKATKTQNSKSFAQKHPFMAAGGALLGAKMLLGGGDQPPAQPPQVVQY